MAPGAGRTLRWPAAPPLALAVRLPLAARVMQARNNCVNIRPPSRAPHSAPWRRLFLGRRKAWRQAGLESLSNGELRGTAGSPWKPMPARYCPSARGPPWLACGTACQRPRHKRSTANRKPQRRDALAICPLPPSTAPPPPPRAAPPPADRCCCPAVERIGGGGRACGRQHEGHRCGAGAAAYAPAAAPQRAPPSACPRLLPCSLRGGAQGRGRGAAGGAGI